MVNIKIITYILAVVIISLFAYLTIGSFNDFDRDAAERDFGGITHRKVNIDINESLPAGGRQW